MRVYVAVNSTGGTVWDAPDGVRYHFWVDALDCPPGRALTNPTTTRAVRGPLRRFETPAEAYAWVLSDMESRRLRAAAFGMVN